MSTPDYPLIPYGWADFRAIRLEGRLYVDKTRFLRPLENERFVFLVRPRRFGVAAVDYPDRTVYRRRSAAPQCPA